MIIERQEQVTDAVLAAMANTADPRLKEIMEALVRHLHAFAREVHLTEPEWEKAIEAVVGLGQLTNDTHNEAVLASDAVGLSTLVCLLNNGNAGNTETAAALLGPFWRMNSPRRDRRSPPHASSATAAASRSRARKWMSGRHRPSACTRTRTRARPT
jgi:catechol 1,2-dioxygenase